MAPRLFRPTFKTAMSLLACSWRSRTVLKTMSISRWRDPPPPCSTRRTTRALSDARLAAHSWRSQVDAVAPPFRMMPFQTAAGTSFILVSCSTVAVAPQPKSRLCVVENDCSLCPLQAASSSPIRLSLSSCPLSLRRRYFVECHRALPGLQLETRRRRFGRRPPATTGLRGRRRNEIPSAKGPLDNTKPRGRDALPSSWKLRKCRSFCRLHEAF